MLHGVSFSCFNLLVLSVHEKDNNYEATRLHFENLRRRYGDPIIILNLIKVSPTLLLCGETSDGCFMPSSLNVCSRLALVLTKNIKYLRGCLDQPCEIVRVEMTQKNTSLCYLLFTYPIVPLGVFTTYSTPLCYCSLNVYCNVERLEYP